MTPYQFIMSLLFLWIWVAFGVMMWLAHLGDILGRAGRR